MSGISSLLPFYPTGGLGQQVEDYVFPVILSGQCSFISTLFIHFHLDVDTAMLMHSKDCVLTLLSHIDFDYKALPVMPLPLCYLIRNFLKTCNVLLKSFSATMIILQDGMMT